MNIKSLYSWAFPRSLDEMAADELRQARFDLMQCETALENNLACKDMLEGRIVRLEGALNLRPQPAPEDDLAEIHLLRVGGSL